MDTKVFYMETRSLNPRYNLAFEEYVLRRRTVGDYLLLWQNDNTVVVGQNQNTVEEIDPAFVEEHRINVVRRITGGGAVYHDLGNLNYSFITDAGDAETITMDRFTRPVVEALRSLGIPADASGRNDILAGGRKVSGTAQRLIGSRILHHGTLLFDTDPAMVSGALRTDPEKFRSKSAKSVRSRIGNIREFLGEDMDMPAFWAYLKRFLAGVGLTECALSAEELAEVEVLKREKYDSWEWNFGRSPRYTMTNKRYWDRGCLEVQIQVEKGRIADVAFFGDFLSICPLSSLTDGLKDTAYTKEAFAAVLDQYPLEQCFGGITREEVLETAFNIDRSPAAKPGDAGMQEA